ncbi:MAG TPA: HAD-IA family hydrolase [Candidatus Acidoferrales bacterium]|nr:HAD-IA family hydrolase [Candidatus Acidoferrales bacterium]
MRIDPLDGIELVVFDKDGTLIEFHRMWRGWVHDLATQLEAATGLPLEALLCAVMGVDPVSGEIAPHGLLAATPMSRIRAVVVAALVEEGLEPAAAERAMRRAWHAPDPVALARPTTDLRRLFDGLAERGIRAAVATSDDRVPTERTLAALGIAPDIAAIACADDGHPVKPAPDPVLRIAARLRVAPDRITVVGDAPADMRMGRTAGARCLVGVLTGVGDEATLGPLADVLLPSIEGLIPA